VQNYEETKMLVDTMNEAFSSHTALRILMTLAHLSEYLSSMSIAASNMPDMSVTINVFFHLFATLLSLSLIAESTSKVILCDNVSIVPAH
jgi:hypothetical protein